MFTDKNENNIPDCIERAAIVATASTMLLTGCGECTTTANTVVEYSTGKIEKCDGSEMLKPMEVDNAGLITMRANFVNYVYLADTGVVYFTGFDSEFPNAITPVISYNGNYIRYNEETQSCEEINVDASYAGVKQVTGKIAVCNGDEMLRKIEVDNSGLITRRANFVNYVYLVDTGIVYFTGFDSEFPNAITPFISKNGNYVRYNEETHSCEEVGVTFDKNAYLKDYLSILPEASVKECKTKEDCDALLEQEGLSKPIP